MSGSPTERLHALDAVRGAALMLGILFHASFSFFPGDTFWIVMDSQRSASISATAFVLHIFRMSIFFLLAGYFGRMQVLRLGHGRFIKDRLKRLGIPLVLGWLITFPIIVALLIWAILVQNGGTMPQDLPPPPPMTLETFPLTHLWFLYALLLMYAAVLVCRAVINGIDRHQVLAGFFDRVIALLAKTAVLPVVLAIPTALAFHYHANWMAWFGIPTPETGFVPNIVSVIAYGSAFGLGWLLQRQPQVLRSFEKFWLPYLGLAIVLSALCLHLIGIAPYYTVGVQGVEKVVYEASYALAIWCWSFGLIGLALRFFNAHSAIGRYLADASYWLYLIHLPLIMAMQVWVSQWTLNPLLKYGFILGLSIPLMLLSYHVLVRYSFIGAILNGKKKTRGI